MLAGAPAVLPIHDTDFAHVRPLDAVTSRLIVDGRRRSPTLNALVGDLERREIVVYVTLSPIVPSRGSLCFVMRTASVTYVIAHINAHQVSDRAIAAIGHELRHALEVAGAVPAVSSAADLEALYRRIGHATGRDRFESEAALVTERAVAAELVRGATRRQP